MLLRSRHAIGPAIALAALTSLWGYNWVVIKIALADAPPLTFSAWRAGLSAVAFFILLIAMRQPLLPARGAALIVLGLLQTTGFVGLVALALENGAAGKSAVLAYTMPFWTLLLAGPLLGEHVRATQWIAIVLAALGLLGILSPWGESLDVTAGLFSLGAAWCWAAANIVIKRLKLSDAEFLNVSAWQMAIGAVGLCALALLDEEPVRWTVSFSVALGYNVVFATALAWILWLYALSRLSAGATGLATLAAPAFAIAAAWLQLGEVPTWSEGVGMGLIVAALGWLSFVGWRRFVRGVAGA
jgi:drug/metabolite transporter (DMT)-like permease